MAHKEGLSKNWILGLPALITLSCRGQPYTFCFRHLEITMAHFSLLFFPSAWNMEAHPPSLAQTTLLPNDISSRRLSLNLALTQALWKLRAQGHLFTTLSSPLETAILESPVFQPHRSGKGANTQ